MNKRTKLIPALILTALIFLSACGKKGMESFDATPSGSDFLNKKSIGQFVTDDSYYVAQEGAYDNSSRGGYDAPSMADSANSAPENINVNQRKIIKTAGLSVQTTEFDDYLEKLNSYVLQFEAYIERSDLTGNTYYRDNRRYANYVIRVPENKLSGFLSTVSALGTVTSKNYNEEDISLTYIDVESRIKTLKTERDTLLRLMEDAKGIDAVIQLEARLSEVNYQIESYESRLRGFDNKIEYSTVNLSISEVERVTTVAPVKQTLGERISSGFITNWNNIVDGVKNFVVWFLSYIINIIVIAIIVAVIVIVIVRVCKKSIKNKKNLKKNDETTKE